MSALASVYRSTAVLSLVLVATTVLAQDPAAPDKTIRWLDHDILSKISKRDRPVLIYCQIDQRPEINPWMDAVLQGKGVQELKDRFRWVRGPEDLCRKLKVEWGDEFLILGEKHENVYRFPLGGSPRYVVRHLEEGLRRWDKYIRGKKWDQPAPRARTVCSKASVKCFVAPGQEYVRAIAVLGDVLWTAQGSALYRVDLRKTRRTKCYDIEPFITGLCTDGKMLYCLELGWTAGKPIHVFNTEKGEFVRRIVTEANKKNRVESASGITWVNGGLLVTDGAHMFRVDPETGEIRSTSALQEIINGLAWDGKNVLTVSTRWSGNWTPAVLLLDPKTFKITGRLEVNYGLSAVDVYKSEHIVTEQPTFAYDANHTRAQVAPDQYFVYRLKLKPDAIKAPK